VRGGASADQALQFRIEQPFAVERLGELQITPEKLGMIGLNLDRLYLFAKAFDDFVFNESVEQLAKDAAE
jgi:hypothetical protein